MTLKEKATLIKKGYEKSTGKKAFEKMLCTPDFMLYAIECLMNEHKRDLEKIKNLLNGNELSEALE